MRSLLPFVLLALGVLVAAEPTLSPYTLHERRSAVPEGWAWHDKHDADAVVPLRFALTQNNIADIEKHLMDISHPDSPNYGQHWTAGKVLQTFAPNDDTVAAVRMWLLENGVDGERIRVTPTKGWVEAKVTVAEAERLLQTEYHVYNHEASGTKTLLIVVLITGTPPACDSYHLPAHIQPHVDFVTPTVHFDAVIAPRDTSDDGSARTIGQPNHGVYPKTTGTVGTLFQELEHCDQQITPVCLRALYGLVYSPLAASKNSYGIVEYTPQAYVQSDLEMFAQNFSSDLAGASPQVVSIDGGEVQTTYKGFGYNGESNLDLQYGMSLVTAKQPVTLYQTGDMIEGASFNNFLDAIDGSYCSFEGGDDPTQDAAYPDPNAGGYTGKEDCGTVKPANVISTSYGYNEADLTPAYTARQCAEYAKLGLMGVTVLYSSGDYGVAGNGGLCLNADGSQSSSGTRFNPTFPGSCPYVTSVGATQVNPNSTVLEPEGACEQVIYSGGGFSNHFALPAYQKAAVDSYFANHNPPYSGAVYNNSRTSRGLPDLSANGANYVVAIDGAFSLVFGTSASSPVVGAILTLVNDARLAVGKKPIGFVNPTIYSDAFGGAFNDITSGGNQGCGTAGFTAVPGWDPVTGLGTPNFPQLVAKWLLLP
ncbi:subtilisin-like protein [Coniophora puteana RWD-64-598 SS2]|uniref:tripeptidyl-peptidase II n=1 Tax=Coniophora puteana (strain RWD-64-598) TaxID=741705 RepID=A0A5M3MP31_CONPW|nr:subtilisin-like protein [Coniophora puteana RWD-64-598 SS2]EIW80494.1 subtilisin-like protein [Coniophora puteana RWD-64-598 SS2]